MAKGDVVTDISNFQPYDMQSQATTPTSTQNSVMNPEYIPEGGSGADLAKNVITGVQFAAGFTPISPLTEFIGEGTKALIDHKSIGTAFKNGATAAGTDLALRVALGGLPTGARKILTKGAADALEQGLLTRAVGKKLLKEGMDVSNARVRQEVVDHLIQNPQLLTKPGKTIDELGKQAYDAVNEFDKSAGKLIGDMKAQVGKDVNIDTTDLMKVLVDKKKEIRMIADEGRSALEDPLGKRAFDVVEKHIVPTVEQKKLILGAGGKLDMQVVKNTVKDDLQDAMVRLNSIDASTPFQRIYTKMANGEKLTTGEAAAYQMRKEFASRIDQGANAFFDNNNLKEAKDVFTKVRRIQDDPVIRRAFTSQDSMTNVLRGSLNEGKAGSYEALKQLDDMLPKNKKFLDDSTRAVVNEVLRVEQPLKSLLNFQAGNVLFTGAGVLGKEMLQPGVRGSAGRSLIRQGAEAVGKSMYGGE